MYQILIDGQLYESSQDYKTALHLYRTVDETCLHHYIGHVKSLVCNGKELMAATITDKRMGIDSLGNGIW